MDLFYQEHQHSEDHALIFNFFYGDDASASLGYTQFGVVDLDVFEYLKQRVSLG